MQACFQLEKYKEGDELAKKALEQDRNQPELIQLHTLITEKLQAIEEKK